MFLTYKKLTLLQLAERAGTSDAYLSQVENAKRNPPKPSMIEKIARGLSNDNEVEYEDLYNTLMIKAGYVDEKTSLERVVTEYIKLLEFIRFIIRVNKEEKGQMLEVKVSTLRGETKHIENDNLTVGQWLDMWFEMNKGKWKPATIEQREIFIKLYLKPYLGSYKIQKLDKNIYQKVFINALETKLKPYSIHFLHKTFRTAINAAVADEILLRNKIHGVALPSIRSRETKRITLHHCN
ncbi:hypothetical protein LSPCS325_26260 [Lysinibacillus sp. CTST325]